MLLKSKVLPTASVCNFYLKKNTSVHTVCPGSSDPSVSPSICIRKLGLHRFLTITIFQVEYYSLTEQNNFRSHALDW